VRFNPSRREAMPEKARRDHDVAHGATTHDGELKDLAAKQPASVDAEEQERVKGGINIDSWSMKQKSG
jgi:hypothetical protein